MNDSDNDGVEPARPAKKVGLFRRWFWILVSLLVLAGVVFVLDVTEDTVDVAETKSPQPLQLVTVEAVSFEPLSV